jgi:hypothetical protein
VRWLRRLALGFVALAVAAAVVWFGGLGPRGPIAGGWLWGEVVETRVDDWSFTNSVREVQLQTSIGPLPYSVTIWNLSDGPGFYVPSGDCSRRWVRQVLADPDVRVRIDGKIYPLRARQVNDAETSARLAPVLLEKYFGIRAESASWKGEERRGCILRLEPRS